MILKNIDDFNQFEDKVNEGMVKYMGTKEKPKKEKKFVGVIYDRGTYMKSWVNDGSFFEFDDEKGAQKFIDDIESDDMTYNSKKVKSIKLVDNKFISDIEKSRKQGQ